MFRGPEVFDSFGTVVTGSGSHPMWVIGIDIKFFARTEKLQQKNIILCTKARSRITKIR